MGVDVNAETRHVQGLSIQDPVVKTPLSEAVARGDVELVAMLLDRGADARRFPLLDAEAARRDPRLADLLARHGAHTRAERLAAGGMAPDGRETLFRRAGRWRSAVIARDFAAAEQLLADGVDVNHRDTLGRTALHEAAARRDVPAVRWLLGQRADVNAPDAGGRTPLHEAAARGTSS
jgi:ankyrin repeat protein